MQTSLDNFSNRLEILVKEYGLKNLSELSEILGYSSPEKIYRLARNPENKPSYDILLDITNKFENISVRWLLTGKGSVKESQSEFKVMEPEIHYKTNEIDQIRYLLNQLEKKLKSK